MLAGCGCWLEYFVFYIFDKFLLSHEHVRLMPNKLRYWDRSICMSLMLRIGACTNSL